MTAFPTTLLHDVLQLAEHIVVYVPSGHVICVVTPPSQWESPILGWWVLCMSLSCTWSVLHVPSVCPPNSRSFSWFILLCNSGNMLVPYWDCWCSSSAMPCILCSSAAINLYVHKCSMHWHFNTAILQMARLALYHYACHIVIGLFLHVCGWSWW